MAQGKLHQGTTRNSKRKNIKPNLEEVVQDSQRRQPFHVGRDAHEDVHEAHHHDRNQDQAPPGNPMGKEVVSAKCRALMRWSHHWKGGHLTQKGASLKYILEHVPHKLPESKEQTRPKS